MRHDVRLLAAALIGVTALLTACGGQGPSASLAQPTASAPSSAATEPSPTSSPNGNGPPAPDVPGYTLEAAPPDALSAFEQLAKSSPDAFTGVSAYAVKSGDQELGAMILFGVDTTGTDEERLSKLLVQSIAKGLAGSGEVSTESLAGVDVVWTEAAAESASAIWYQDGVLVMTIGAGRAELTPFVTSAIEAGS